MRTTNWILTAALLVSVSAAAQQAANSQASAQPATPDTTQTAQPLQQEAAPAQEPQSTPVASQPAAGSAQQPSAQSIAPPATVPAPTTMDQVVNLFIEREHGLIKALSNGAVVHQISVPWHWGTYTTSEQGVTGDSLNDLIVLSGDPNTSIEDKTFT